MRYSCSITISNSTLLGRRYMVKMKTIYFQNKKKYYFTPDTYLNRVK